MAEPASVVAKRWADRLGQSTEAYKRGVNGVMQSPTAMAADKADKMVAGVQRAVSTGKFQAACRAVSLESWKQQTAMKGAERLATGARAAESKMTQFLNEFLPALDTIAARVNSMPDDTREQRIAKSSEMQRLLGEWGDRRRGS